MAVGKKLGEIIAQSGLTQKEIADIAGINPQTLNNIIVRDSARADIQILLRICRVLNVNVEIFSDDAIEEFYADHPNSKFNHIVLSQHEKKLIFAYRQNTKMRSAVDTLLGIADETISADESSDKKGVV